MIRRTSCRAHSFVLRSRRLPTATHSRPNSTSNSPTPDLPKPAGSNIRTWLGASILVASLGLGYYATARFIIGDNSTSSGPLSDTKFTPLKIISTAPAGQDAKLILLEVPPHLRPNQAELAPVFSFYIKDTDIQVQRPYTPLNGIDDHGHITLWVKKYYDGEVSRWLHRKNVGDELELRGPIRTFDFKDGEYDEIIMISGGTGVTPFVQLLNSVFSKRTPTSPPLKTHFTLLHASQSPAALPIADVLINPLVYSVAERRHLIVRLFVDFPTPGGETAVSNTNLQVGRISKEDVVRVLRERDILARPQTWWEWIRGTKPRCATEKKLLFLVCGPEPMITAFSGSRLLRRRPEDQPVGGILGELGFTSRQVKPL
ncbi:hypothetical protein RhiJN_15386 [Ceratobasidium sp. AG-Ba]|nr:hypothetical protein RhiJN_15386 [Ceratobasidium sp. AG-Ba]